MLGVALLWRRIVAAFFLALFLGLGGVTFWAVLPEEVSFDREALLEAARAYQVRIVRDAWGVPHIRGKRDADVAYGLGFAHSEDDFFTIQKVLLATRGTLAAVDGMDAAPIDFMTQWMGVWEAVDAGYESQLSPGTRAIVEAYAVGVNHYAALHPEQVLPGVIPVNGKDLVAGFTLKMPLFYGLQRTVLELFGEQRQRDLALAPSDRAFQLTAGPQPILGSNAVAVAPARSADGATRLLVNSHQPYTGPVAWYEVRLESEEGWDVAGGVFPGSPVMIHGTNRHLGWASTINQPDLADVYVLDVDPDDPNRYRVDGVWHELQVSEARFSVQLFGRLRWTVSRELLRSMHGPVVRSDHGSYALRFVGQGEVRALEQYYRMNKARSFEEWQDAMELQALPSINFVYADREGNIAYVYNAKSPKRAPGWDWKAYLPGDRSDLIWQETHSYAETPQLVNPGSHFVVSANHDPFRATTDPHNLRREDFPATHGIETRITNRALRALELYGGDDSITREEFRRYKYDKRYSEHSEVRAIVAEVLAADAETLGRDPDLLRGQEILAAWDFSVETNSRTAALGIVTATPVIAARMRELPPVAPLDAYREAVAVLKKHHGRLDPTWGEVNRFRRGDLDLPANGGPDLLRALESFVLDEHGTYDVQSGDCFLMFVEWNREGAISVETIHQYGSATLDPSSPHFDDQVRPFLEERTKRIPWSLDEVLPTATRDYAPGQPG